ncbi:S-layer homology domain-containing protein [Cohnella zeiphila]|uniref:S-layer homology domain-containing protein n=1 Tax=Cohnella zeiphila TaxID=2761120 RepID=A0A7X0VUA0_9BACL|nr:S-layer homology domain-containing protein [Cohnella zeiphila]MBB6730794.1 S-layer homology domain-containing protein [Cohnella zeiphila]
MRRLFIVFTALLLFVGLVPAPFFANSKAFASGDGSADDPFVWMYKTYIDYGTIRAFSPTSDGGYIAGAGRYLLKLDKNGTVDWSLPVASGVNSTIRGVRETAGGYVYAGSDMDGSFQPHWAFGEASKDGRTLNWDAGTNGTDIAGDAEAVLETGDGGYIAVGNSGAGGYMVQTDAGGAVLHESSIASPSGADLTVYAAVTTDGGNVLVAGSAKTPGGQTAGYVAEVRISSLGEVAWERLYPWNDSNVFQSISAIPDQNQYLLTGNTLSGSGQNGAMTLIDGENGDPIWEKSYATGDSSLLLTAALASDGGFIAAGGNNQRNSLLLKTDASGELQWYKWFSQTHYGNLSFVKPLTDGSYLAAGGTYGAGLLRVKRVSVDYVTNRLIGLDETMVYSTNGGSSYIPYDPDEEPVFDGTETVYVAYSEEGAAGYDLVFPARLTFIAKSITAVGKLDDVQVPYGTALNDVPLPERAEATLSDGTKVSAAIDWNRDASNYDDRTPGIYEFVGTLTLPGGMTNPDGLEAKVNVTVGEPPAEPVTVAEVSGVSDLRVANGTALEEAGLPTQASVKLSNGVSVTVSVTWDGGTPAYEGTQAGTYAFVGTLALPDGVTNPDGLAAKANVIVAPKPEEPPASVTVTEVPSLADLEVRYGTQLSEAGLPAKVAVKRSDGNNATVSVTWDGGTPAYDGTQAGTYEFVGTLTLPDGVTNPDGLKAAIRVTVQGQASAYPPPPALPDPSDQDTVTVACPTGGCTAGLGDEISIDIPDGAADGPFTLTIRKLDSDPANVPAGWKPLSSVYELLKSFSVTFARPVTLRFKFRADEVGEGRHAALSYFDEERGGWVEVPGRIGDGVFTAQVNHFTKFAVFSVQNLPDEPPVPVHPFADAAGHWAEDSIRSAAALGWVQGNEKGLFLPDRAITRAEFAAMLVRALGAEDVVRDAPSFADSGRIPAWAQAPVSAAAEAGWIGGYADGTFRPGEPLTRAEMAAIAARALGLPTPSPGEAPFSDWSQVPAWARDAAAAARQAGIVTGADGNAFAPNRRTTRAEATVVIVRMLDSRNR